MGGESFIEDLEMNLIEELELVARFSRGLCGGGVSRVFWTEDTGMNAHGRPEGRGASKAECHTSLSSCLVGRIV